MRLILLASVAIAVLISQGYINIGFLLKDPIAGMSAGRLAEEEPVQTPVTPPRKISHKGFDIQLMHKFDLRALVLSSEHYRLDKESKLAPVDLALGWGVMSNPAPLQLLRIKQRNRFYYYHYPASPPIPPREIALNSANMHMVPANDEVEKKLKDIRRGDVIVLDGYLVSIKNPKTGWNWRSSTTRSDTGHGACEVVYVERIKTVSPR